MPDATIHARAEVLECRERDLYWVSLPNGKRVLAHLSKPLTEEGAAFAVGDVLRVEMTPYDFDTARILGRED
jgi:translation initiation factor IF-1